MRRAFTLIEFLVIVAIAGLMVTVTVVSASGKSGAARLRGATRDIFATMRRARSTALMTQHPVVVAYSCEMLDDEPVAKVEVTSTKVMDAVPSRGEIQKLTGGYLMPGDDGVSAEDGDTEAIDVEGWLFEKIPVDVVKGVRIKVVVGSDDDAYAVTETSRRRNISTWSNTDYLLNRYKKAREKSSGVDDPGTTEKPEEKDGAGKTSSSDDDLQEPVHVVWETNGRVKSHQIWVYLDGTSPEDGLSIKVDRFGGVKILARGEERP